MNSSEIHSYRCPVHLDELTPNRRSEPSDEMVSGVLVSPKGRSYPVERGIPNFLYPDELSEIESRTKDSYDKVAEDIYDAAVDWQFAAFREDESSVRELMVDLLDLRPSARVLEVGCGTGRDSFRLARRLDSSGSLYMQDLSPNMVYHCREKMDGYREQMNLTCGLKYFISNASYLPFPDGYFDAVFHFGGFNEFGEKKRAASEFARVTKVGGKVLFGDESVAPWLRNTEFDGIVTTNNPLFRHEVPLSLVPESARNLELRWVIGNCFYVISFVKGDGPPPLDLDLPHAGRRGGTLRTRYFGKLEGVTEEAKQIAIAAAAEAGLGLHDWLDRLVRSAGGKAVD